MHGNRPPPRIPPPQLVAPRRADPAGTDGPTPAVARGRKWRTAAPGFFVPADAAVEQPAQRILEASLRCRDRAVVSGWASLHLAGAPWFEGRDAWLREQPVLLVSGHKMQGSMGVRTLRAPIEPADCVMRHGIRCADVHQSLFDEIRIRGRLRSAVSAIDMVMHARLTTLHAFAAWLDAHRHTPGVVLARRALNLARPGAESPQETGLRLFWQLDVGAGPLIANPDIHSASGMWLARVDLLDPVAGVIGDYDGDHHRDTRQRSNDITRELRLRDHGLEYFSVVGGEIHRKELVRQRILDSCARAAASATPRTWEIRLPVDREQWPRSSGAGSSGPRPIIGQFSSFPARKSTKTDR